MTEPVTNKLYVHDTVHIALCRALLYRPVEARRERDRHVIGIYRCKGLTIIRHQTGSHPLANHGQPETYAQPTDDLHRGAIDDTRSQEHLPVKTGLGFLFGLDGQQDLAFRGLHLLRVDRSIIETRQSLVALGVAVFGVVIARRVGQEEHTGAGDEGEDALEGNGHAPRVLGVGFDEAVVDPVGDGHA